MNKDHVDKVSDERTAETQSREAGARVPDSEKDGEPLNRCPCCWGEVDAGAAAAGVYCAKCGTAVKWTRCDGTPETLPEERVPVYVFRPAAGRKVYITELGPGMEWGFSEVWEGLDAAVQVGDCWCRIPKPVEEKK